jgi:hypothetical protein
MYRLVWLGLAALLAAAPARGDEKELPKTAPPRVVSVAKVDGDVVEYWEFVLTPPLPVKAGAVKPGAEGTPPVPSAIPLAIKFSLKAGTVYDLAGNKVAPEAAKRRLAKGDMVLVSADFRPVDPAYLKVFTKDLLILVHPLPGPAPGLPKPAKKDK